MCHLSDKGSLIIGYLTFIIAHFYDLLTTSSLVNLYVIPAQAGIQKKLTNRNWIPASTGMTMDMLFTNRTT